MQYIILDMEWNQPLNFQSQTYKRYGDRMLFELIQIGAVRVSENLDIQDSISLFIHPNCYTTIHPRVEEMTGITKDSLADCPDFPDAMEEFTEWCGEDCIFLTWGDADISVLKQNLDFYELDSASLPFYDIQPLMVRSLKLDHCMKLSAALELMGLQPEEDMPFHNALNDALYTAEIFTHLPDAASVMDFPLTPRPIQHQEPKPQKGDLFESVTAALSSIQASEPLCPICARTAALQGGYVPQSYTRFIGLARCPRHGQQLVRISFERKPDGMVAMNIRSVRASRYNIAYVHTKQMQMLEKANQGHAMDPDHAAMYTSGADMPMAHA